MEEPFLFNPETGNRHRLGGCICSDKPSNEPKYSANRVVKDKELPPSVDLRQLMTPVEHQQELNSCVGNALAAAYEFLIMKNTGKHVDVSRLFIYYNSRVKDGLHEYDMHDRGTLIPNAIAALHEFGCCKEEMYPYHSTKVNRKPPLHCYSEAKKYCIKEGMAVQTNLNEMKACLAENYPFTFGLETFESFNQAETNGGRVSTPQVQSEKQNSQHGWHAMLAVGYSDKSQCFIVKNSWGEKWGDKGYCYISYDYMCNPEHCRDAHAIKLITEDRTRRTEKVIPNKFDWYKHRDVPYYVPSNYKYSFFDDHYFWNFNDPYDYFQTTFKCGKTFPFAWFASASPYSGANGLSAAVSVGHDLPMSYILWIDRNSEDNARVMKKLKSNKHVHIDFRETFSMAEDHMQKNMKKIKFSSPLSKFQIICRGYYKNENKNPLNLLHLLNNYQLKHIPIIVFTQDKQGVRNHLEHQAQFMGIHDWKDRLYITDNTDDLMRQIKANLAN